MTVRSQLSRLSISAAMLFSLAQPASAVELDWSGQFRTEFNFVAPYTMNWSEGTPPMGSNGYGIVTGGQTHAVWQNLFLRLKPKLVVNDNVYIKSEWWIGDPQFGIFGNSLPFTLDKKQFYSTQNRGGVISAQRLWAEFLSDFGYVKVGRAPLHWGLGIFWNAGDQLFDRYMSTGDQISWVGKLGNFTLTPTVIVQSQGNTIGGSCTITGGGTACVAGPGSGSVADYSVALKYENTDEDLEAGFNFVRRIGASSQDAVGGMMIPGTGGSVAGSMIYNTFDIYIKKAFGPVSLGAEVPYMAGTLGGASFQTFAVAGEANWKVTEKLDFNLKGGYAPGQPNSGSATIDTFRAFYFNPGYKIAMIMFNYQFANFSGAQTRNDPESLGNELRSPYDNPIVNAVYVAGGGGYKLTDKLTLKANLAYAFALNTATGGQNFFNYWTRGQSAAPAVTSQSGNHGFEADLTGQFQWDESFLVALDFGAYLPGDFYAFTNAAGGQSIQPVLAGVLRAGISF